MKYRVLLADDHEIMLGGLRSLLAQESEFEVVAEAHDGQAAVSETIAKRPDIVVMDVSMPGMNGIESTRKIVAALPEAKVICLSMHAETSFVEAALQAGACGYLTKESALEDLVRAIRAVCDDRVYLCPRVAGGVVRNRSFMGKQKTQETTMNPVPSSILTDREREVLQLLAEGFSTKAIGERLGVSPKTVGSHREHVMVKLGLHSIAGLTKYAIRHGITTVDR